MPRNMHYYFNKEYPEILIGGKKTVKEIEDVDASNDNDKLFSVSYNLDAHKSYQKTFSDEKPILLQVRYPGLLVGLGNAHATGAKAEVGLGFTFDYVTGQPYIPGSTVKGVLRSAFKHKDFISEILEEICGKVFEEADVTTLEHEIFNGKYVGENLKLKDGLETLYPYASFEIEKDKKAEEEYIDLPIFLRDTFYDAFVDFELTKPVNENDKVLYLIGKEAITPHNDNPLKTPNPLTLAKVKPGVVFKFCFSLHDGMITASQKRELFEFILKELGIGAKTNVGFGVLDKVDENIKVSAPHFTLNSSNSQNQKQSNNGSSKIHNVTVTGYDNRFIFVEVVFPNGKRDSIHVKKLKPKQFWSEETLKKEFPVGRSIKVKYYHDVERGEKLTMIE